MDDYLADIVMNIYQFNQDLMRFNIKQAEVIEEQKQEIERLKTELQDTKEHLGEYLYEQEENKRLNNIINKLEHHLYQEWLEWKDSDCESIYSRAGEDKAIYDYLQELKGSDKE